MKLSSEIKSNIRSFAQCFEKEKKFEAKKIMEELLSNDDSSQMAAVKKIKELAQSDDLDFKAVLGFLYYTSVLDMKEELKKVWEYFKTSAQAGSLIGAALVGLYLANEKIEMAVKKELELLNAASQKGCALAQYALGMLYFNGKYVKKNEITAFDLLGRAAKQGHDMAKCLIASKALSTGNIEYGLKLFEEASIQGYAYADFFLGREYIEANFIPRNVPKGLALLEKAMNNDIEEAGSYLANAYDDGENEIEKDSKKAFEIFLAMANKGNLHGQIQVAIRYSNGEGITRDLNQAKFWLEKAIMHESSNKKQAGFYHLGVVYLKENFVLNKLQAFQMFVKGAKMDSIHCLIKLKTLYKTDKKYFEEALAGFIKESLEAANQDDPIALGNLGFIHSFILENPQDQNTMAQCIEYYKKASDLNNSWAAFHLGYLLETGFGMPLSIRDAFHQYKKAGYNNCDEDGLDSKLNEIETLWEPLVYSIGESFKDFNGKVNDWTNPLNEIIAEYTYDRDFYQKEKFKKELNDCLNKECLFMYKNLQPELPNKCNEGTVVSEKLNDLIVDYCNDPQDEFVDLKVALEIN